MSGFQTTMEAMVMVLVVVVITRTQVKIMGTVMLQTATMKTMGMI
jgi:hypothetical protein